MPLPRTPGPARAGDGPIPDTTPRQPWLHELVTAVHGNTTALSDRAGAMSGPGTGLYVDDRRVLSRLDAWLGEHPTDAVTARATGPQAHFTGSARHLGNPGADPTVEVHRHRVLDAGSMTETITVTSRAAQPVRSSLVVLLAGDGAPLHEVKAGLDGRPYLATAAESGEAVASWSDEGHRTTVRSSPVPDRVVPGATSRPTRLEYAVDIAPGASVTVVLGVHAERLAASSFDADPAADRADWRGARVRADDARLDRVVEHALRDLEHLLMNDPVDRRDIFAGAGSPWYLTLFGRDALWTARLALPFSLELAAGTLAVLARRQGTVTDPRTAQEPGKILHEVRRELGSGCGAELPPVYYGTVDATALWVCLLHDAWRRGLPEERVRALVPHLEAAMGWIERCAAASPDGLLRYVDASGAGLANQGWKDSGDSMRRADGSIAPAPIALVEAQAYAAEAARGAAALGAALGLGEPARWAALADTLAERIRQRYWVGTGTERRLAMAVAGDGTLVDGIGSNMGHVLGSGALTDEEAARVAAALTSPDLLGPHGISTLSRSNPAYNPIGYHTGSVWTHDTAICALGLARAGFADEAALVARALVDAGAELGYRWPELYSGEPVLGAPSPYPAACRPQAWSAASAAAIVTAVLGLRVDVPRGLVHLHPAAAAPFGGLTVEGLVYGRDRFSVTVTRTGEVRTEGLPAGVTVRVGG